MININKVISYIDFDGTLVKHYNTYKGIIESNLVVGLTYEEFLENVDFFYKKYDPYLVEIGYYDRDSTVSSGEVFDDSIDFLLGLSKFSDIKILTARPQHHDSHIRNKLGLDIDVIGTSGENKSRWLECDLVGRTYDKVYFIDDDISCINDIQNSICNIITIHKSSKINFEYIKRNYYGDKRWV